MEIQERCRLSEKLLPESDYRKSLTRLHDQMLAYINELETQYINGLVSGFTELYGQSEEEAQKDADKEMQDLRGRFLNLN